MAHLVISFSIAATKKKKLQDKKKIVLLKNAVLFFLNYTRIERFLLGIFINSNNMVLYDKRTSSELKYR